jgi:hypothetical protein
MSTVNTLQTELETLFPPSKEELELKAALSTRTRLRTLLIDHPHSKHWMPADEQIRWTDASRPRPIVGHSTVWSQNGAQGDYICFAFDNQEYHKNETGIFVRDSNGELVRCDDSNVRSSIEKLESEEKKVLEARDQLAKDYAEGDPILQEILRIHLEFNDGQIRPLVHEGILFFQVGRNASHEFYVGLKDGKRFVLSSWGEEDIDENGETTSYQTCHSLREIQGEDWGYLGHF